MKFNRQDQEFFQFKWRKFTRMNLLTKEFTLKRNKDYSFDLFYKEKSGNFLGRTPMYGQLQKKIKKAIKKFEMIRVRTTEKLVSLKNPTAGVAFATQRRIVQRISNVSVEKLQNWSYAGAGNRIQENRSQPALSPKSRYQRVYRTNRMEWTKQKSQCGRGVKELKQLGGRKATRGKYFQNKSPDKQTGHTKSLHLTFIVHFYCFLKKNNFSLL